MNGKEYLLSSLEKVAPIASDLESSDKVDGGLAEGLAKACEVLGSFKNKATLRTKNGASIAIPVICLGSVSPSPYKVARRKAPMEPSAAPNDAGLSWETQLRFSVGSLGRRTE